LTDPNLHPLVRAVCCGQIVLEKDIESLEKADTEDECNFFFVDEKFSVKRILKGNTGSESKEFEFLIECQCEHVI
jgi:hypothetical protein